MDFATVRTAVRNGLCQLVTVARRQPRALRGFSIVPPGTPMRFSSLWRFSAADGQVLTRVILSVRAVREPESKDPIPFEIVITSAARHLLFFSVRQQQIPRGLTPARDYKTGGQQGGNRRTNRAQPGTSR